MILSALASYYEILAQRGEAPVPGWEKGKVTFALCINKEGQLTDLLPTTEQVERGKKLVSVPKAMALPLGAKRTVGVEPNFLWDNATYLLGLPKKNPERDLLCYQSSVQLHRRLLEPVEHPAAQAVCRFFQGWEPAKAVEHPVLLPYLEELQKGGNLVFRVDGEYLHDIPAVKAVWDREYSQTPADAVLGQCLITGERTQVARLHTAIKGVQGAQSSGAALVSFNADAFCSYGKEQNYNAPVSEKAAFAYTTALNTLLAEQNHRLVLGDTTVIWWAIPPNVETAPAYADFFAGMLDPDRNNTFSEKDLACGMDAIRQGKSFPFQEAELHPGTPFFILGLAPNAARLSVRFFYQDSFGDMGKNILAHYERLEITRPSSAPKYLSPWGMIRETANQNAKDKTPPKILTGAIMQAILANTPYPPSLFSSILLRIRATRNINWRQAAILKAYFLKSPHKDVPEEVLRMDPNASHVPYVLGRLFSVLEAIQLAAIPNIKTTIRDNYFSSASTTPGYVFSTLIDRAQKHLKKLPIGQRKFFEDQLIKLSAQIGETCPERMTPQQRVSFQLGYYYQTQIRYSKKEGEKDNG